MNDLSRSDRAYLQALADCDDGVSWISAYAVARRLRTSTAPSTSAIVTGKALSKLARRDLCQRRFGDGMWWYRPLGH